jgi:hypothetical protein
MKLYKTTYTVHTGDFAGRVAASWQTSATEASKARTALKAADKNSKPASEVVEVLTDKAGLVAFLTALTK